ncbi:hypothetical protein ACFXO2_30015 [Streptomyces sp. NPDC059152]|uniref:hypothetical protein n=1 Tax=Streptomyces sp. NPDC059152 TaxID=3346742 RepID=UPI0036B279F3
MQSGNNESATQHPQHPDKPHPPATDTDRPRPFAAVRTWWQNAWAEHGVLYQRWEELRQAPRDGWHGMAHWIKAVLALAGIAALLVLLNAAARVITGAVHQLFTAVPRVHIGTETSTGIWAVIDQPIRTVTAGLVDIDVDVTAEPKLVRDRGVASVCSNSTTRHRRQRPRESGSVRWQRRQGPFWLERRQFLQAEHSFAVVPDQDMQCPQLTAEVGGEARGATGSGVAAADPRDGRSPRWDRAVAAVERCPVRSPGPGRPPGRQAQGGASLSQASLRFRSADICAMTGARAGSSGKSRSMIRSSWSASIRCWGQ